jgi:hypothetical protein
MTALTALTVVLPALTLCAAAVQTPTDTEGNRVNRHRRTLWGDLRCLVGGTY